jgi:hypothetical protein
MAQRSREKSWVVPDSGGGKRNLGLKPGFDEVVFYECRNAHCIPSFQAGLSRLL